MITYGFSLQGKSHVDKGVVCQDFNKVERLKCGLYMGIVADGVGSAAKSDVGSKLAVESLYTYCDKNIKKDSTEEMLETILAEGYMYALEQIAEYAKEQEEPLQDFDTTMSSVIYDGKKVVYGHAGDGGIIVRFSDGRSESITKRQKGADGVSVRPLRAGESSWEFGAVEDVVAVLLVTDGMLDGVIQPNLINLPPDRMSMVRGNYKQDNVYVTAAEFFMNPYSVYMNKFIKNPDEYMQYFLAGELSGNDQGMFLKCMASTYMKLLGKEEAAQAIELLQKVFFPVGAMVNVTDDKSVVCIMKEKAKMKSQDFSYYAEPDWERQQKLWEELMYGRKTPSVEKNVINVPTRDSLTSNESLNTAGKSSALESLMSKRKFPLIMLVSALAVLLIVCSGTIVMLLLTSDSDKKNDVATSVSEGAASPVVIPTESPQPTYDPGDDTGQFDGDETAEEVAKDFRKWLLDVEVNKANLDDYFFDDEAEFTLFAECLEACISKPEKMEIETSFYRPDEISKRYSAIEKIEEIIEQAEEFQCEGELKCAIWNECRENPEVIEQVKDILTKVFLESLLKVDADSIANKDIENLEIFKCSLDIIQKNTEAEVDETTEWASERINRLLKVIKNCKLKKDFYDLLKQMDEIESNEGSKKKIQQNAGNILKKIEENRRK